jgi:hypothetical protein
LEFSGITQHLLLDGVELVPILLVLRIDHALLSIGPTLAPKDQVDFQEGEDGNAPGKKR